MNYIYIYIYNYEIIYNIKNYKNKCDTQNVNIIISYFY